MKNNKSIERIEKELFALLLDYAVPFLSKKTKDVKPKNDENNLESLVLNSKPKVSFGDFKELEMALLAERNSNIKFRRIAISGLNEISYSVEMARRKAPSRSTRYSLTIQYEETSLGDRLKVTAKKGGKKVYSTEETNEKEAKDNVAPYKVIITYEDSYGEERLSIKYIDQMRNYMKRHINDKEDMTNRVPLKWLNIHPESTMGGVLGFTYIGDPAMGRRADLTGWMARMVDIHESIHTPDEYETRVLTSWIMERVKGKYIK